MDCREVEERLPAYALNALSPEEAGQVEAHLDACPWCTALLREHLQVAAGLAGAAERLQPPRELRERTIRAALQGSRQRRMPGERPLSPHRVALGAAATVAVLLFAGVIAVGFLTYDQIHDLERENAKLAAQVSQLSHEDQKLVDMFLEQRLMSYIMAAPDKQVLTLQAARGVPHAQGVLLIASPGGTGILMAKGLEPSSGDEAYHVWLENNGQRITAGRLSVDDTGWGVLTLWPDQPITLFRRVLVTMESAGGGAGAAGGPVLWGSIIPR